MQEDSSPNSHLLAKSIQQPRILSKINIHQTNPFNSDSPDSKQERPPFEQKHLGFSIFSKKQKKCLSKVLPPNEGFKGSELNTPGESKSRRFSINKVSMSSSSISSIRFETPDSSGAHLTQGTMFRRKASRKPFAFNEKSAYVSPTLLSPIYPNIHMQVPDIPDIAHPKSSEKVLVNNMKNVHYQKVNFDLHGRMKIVHKITKRSGMISIGGASNDLFTKRLNSSSHTATPKKLDLDSVRLSLDSGKHHQKSVGMPNEYNESGRVSHSSLTSNRFLNGGMSYDRNSIDANKESRWETPKKKSRFFISNLVKNMEFSAAGQSQDFMNNRYYLGLGIKRKDSHSKGKFEDGKESINPNK